VPLPGFGGWHEDPLWASFYDWTVEHPAAGGALWRIGIGSDLGLLYEAAEEIGRQPPGARILDVPCGGGVALRGLKPGQGVSYVAADIAREMLERIYFDARLSVRWPTVEVRVADVATLPFAAVLLAMLVRGLVETAARAWEAGEEPVDHSVSLLRLAAWRAARSGLEEELLHPATMRRMPAESVVAGLLEHVGEALEETGDLERARTSCARLLEGDTGAGVQRRVLAETDSLREVVTACARQTQA